MELGADISRDYEGKELVLIGILKGAAVFMADLMREITLPIGMDYMSVSSYDASSTSSGVITVKKTSTPTSAANMSSSSRT